MSSDGDYQQLLRIIRYEVADLISASNGEDDLYQKVIKICNSGLPEDDQEDDANTIANGGYPKIRGVHKP